MPSVVNPVSVLGAELLTACGSRLAGVCGQEFGFDQCQMQTGDWLLAVRGIWGLCLELPVGRGLWDSFLRAGLGRSASPEPATHSPELAVQPRGFV